MEIRMKRILLMSLAAMVALFMVAGLPGLASADWSTHFKKQPEGYGNCIFSTKEIGKGKESKVTIKSSFKSPDKVYARCYFPGKVGKLRQGKNFWHESWVDRKLKRRTFFKQPPNPGWKQIQIWVSEDEYKKDIRGLGRGKHEIIIWVMKNTYKGKRAEAVKDASGKIKGKMKEVWVPVRLSKGKFTYTK